jgi:hypothetical protein
MISQKKCSAKNTGAECAGLTCFPLSFLFNEKSTVCIESFEVTIFIRLLFTGFECEKGAVGMVLADIGNAEPQ